MGAAFLSIGSATPGAGPTVAGIVTLVALVVFIISFAFSLGPVVWTVINEIFPGSVRGRAVAFATAVNWGAAFVVSEFFLTLVDAIGESWTFWLSRVLLRRRRNLDLSAGTGNQGPLARTDPGAVECIEPGNDSGAYGSREPAANRSARKRALTPLFLC